MADTLRVVSTDSSDVDRFYREFGQRLHDKRVQAGLSQEALGGAVGLNRTSISNIEKGRQRLLMHQLPVLARVLSATTDELLPVASAPDVLGGLTGADRDAIDAVRQARSTTAASSGVGHGPAR